jgi:nucleotide sugar dehydrogenase
LSNTHPRVNIHQPGAGVGGSCIPKDPYLLIHKAKDLGFNSKIILASRHINEQMPLHVVELVINSLRSTGRDIKKSKICVLGTAYKGGVADSRLSPSEEVIKRIMKLGIEIAVYDPHCKETFGAKAAESLLDALREADCVVIMTDHPEFKKMDLSKLKGVMNKNPVIVDGRRIINPTEAEKFNFTYIGIGYGKKEIA